MFITEMRRGTVLPKTNVTSTVKHCVENNRLEPHLLFIPWCSGSLGCRQCGTRSIWSLCDLPTLQSELWLPYGSLLLPTIHYDLE